VLDRESGIADAWPVNQRFLGVAFGVIGLALGIIAAAADVRALAVLAGLAALAAGAVAWISPAKLAAVATPPPAAPAAPVVETTPAPPAAANAPTAAQMQAARAMVESGGADANSPGALVDPLTGLFNEEFFHIAVDTRVSAARRHLRPVSVVLFEVAENVGTNTRPADPVTIAEGIKGTLREADTACRLLDGRFAFVLEDTPEDGAIWTVERLRRRLSETATDQTRWAGIACYPAHAFSSSEVLAKAERALTSAKEWAQDRIEVAAAE
jgi:diguanylate cyclase (GGDEF)-like protein